MSYIVLARKWRPRDFTQVAGQEHVIQTLSNAITLNRLHHAYLFTGTRGVGKTTIARILARCLNCETGLTITPCGQCTACKEISEGRFVDLIEVDAASRTGVDNMRELLENVQYAPSVGRYKIYLIDEVHMLSTSSFNALLKTLEEPPPHIKFLFATTNPQKIPMTILSRCLKLNLTRISDETIHSYLQNLLDNEKISYEQKALNEIIVGAQGSMRDALSLLDQAIAYGNGKLEDQAVDHMLGLHSRDYLIDIFECIAKSDASGLMQIINNLHCNATDFTAVIDDFIGILHQVAVCQALPSADLSSRFDVQKVKQIAEKITPEDIQLAYQIALVGKRDMPLVGDDKSGFEMTMLRILNFVPMQESDTPARQEKSVPTVTRKKAPPPPPQVATAETSELAQISDPNQWTSLINKLDLPQSIKNICLNALPKIAEPDHVILLMDESASALCDPSKEKLIGNALNKLFNRTITLEIALASDGVKTPAQVKKSNDIERENRAQSSIDNDPDVALFQKEFDAEIVPDSMQPIDNRKKGDETLN